MTDEWETTDILVTGIAVVRVVILLNVSLIPNHLAYQRLIVLTIYTQFQDPWGNADGMWAVRETFVAIVTTNLPPIAPLIRKWCSPCLGRMESASDEATKDTTKQSKLSDTTKRSASRASRKSQKQVLHNKTMSDRYLSGFGTHEPLSGSESDINMETYATSEGKAARPHEIV